MGLNVQLDRLPTIWLTGLSGSGKTTISNALKYILDERGIRSCQIDGDEIRKTINKDLGFSQEDRRENIRRVAEICKMFNDVGVITIVSLISPMEEDRKMAKEIIQNFLEVYVNTPLSVCKARDVKELYKKSDMGLIKGLTGVDAPYEPPIKPCFIADTTKFSAQEIAEQLSRMVEIVAH